MSEYRCLRCNTVPLIELDPRDPRISFFACPNCGRHYALKPGKGLTFRWRHPISLVLYRVLFRPHLPQQPERIAAEFVEHRPPDELRQLIEEIQLELDEPTQQVRDILDSVASESDLREFLRLFVAEAEKLLRGRHSPE